MFCFGKGGAGPAMEGLDHTNPSSTGDQGEWSKPEDVISDISSDGKYEIDIPTIKEFDLANIENVKFIDHDNDSESDDGEKHDAESITDSISESLIRDTVIKIAPSLSTDYAWNKSNKFLLDNVTDSASDIKINSHQTSSSVNSPEGGILNKDNLIADNNGPKGTASSADLASRLHSQHLARQESDDLFTETCDNAAYKQEPPHPPPGPRFKLLTEGDIQLCQLNHTRTLISKILSSKFLRRWESHHLYLGDTAISSKTPNLFLDPPLSYTSMIEVYSITHWDQSQKFCLRIVIKDGSLLLQANNSYTRDQWYHSIQWKKNLHKFRNILSQSTRKEVIIKELKNMVDYVLTTPLQDETITSEPLDIISKLFSDTSRWCDSNACHEEAIQIVGPLLATSSLPPVISAVLTHQCRSRPRSPKLRDTLAQVTARILKHNVDFGKATHSRRLVQEYISALYNQNDGEDVLRSWVNSVHGMGAICPHPRVLPNLASACLAALHHPTHIDPELSPSAKCPTPITASLTTTPATVSLPNTPITPLSPAINKISTSDILFSSTNTDSPLKQIKLNHLVPNNNASDGIITPPLTPTNEEHVEEIQFDHPDNVKNDLMNLKSEIQKNEINLYASKNLINGYKSNIELSIPQIIESKVPDPVATENNELVCFASVIKFMSEYTDWAEGLGGLLQPVPVPNTALQHQIAGNLLAKAAGHLGRDPRCSVHSRMLSLRPPRPGWFQLLCPTLSAVQGDHLHTWGDMLETLLNCCCKRKKFLTELTEMLPACLLLALRAHPAGLESLCLMLEWELLNDEQQRLDAVQALRTSAPGRRALHNTCQKQVHLKKLQQKGGPRRLTLPSRATDADVARLLASGSFGNLECLSLAFTHVTSAVAEQLIKLPSLRYLNLWATQFGDAGVLLISEHLHNLQVLNLCETPVSDHGISALSSLPRLKKLNLNSTKLTAGTWNRLRQSLPALQESDVKYTDAW